MTLLVMTAVLIGASLFLWAGLEKVRNMTATVSTLRQLGMPAGLSGAATLLVALAEIMVAIALVFRPDSGWTQGGVVVLAGGFAVAGVAALRKGEAIRCACFGSTGKGYLGAKQIIAFFAWVGGVGLLHGAGVAQPAVEEATVAFAGLGLFMATVRLRPLFRAWQVARGDRRAAYETYVWLRT